MKITILGGSSTGKSTIIRSYVGASVRPNGPAGVCERNFQDVVNGEMVSIKLYDGAESTSDVVHCSDGIVIVFSKHCVSSFQKLDQILSDIERMQQQQQPIVVAATFNDIPEPEGASASDYVSYDEGRHYAKSIDAAYFEICSDNRNDVTEVFHTLIKKIITLGRITSPPSRCDSNHTTPSPIASSSGGRVFAKDTVSNKPKPPPSPQQRSGPSLTPKIVIFGAGGSGKSAFVLRYLYGNFVPTEPTICDTYRKQDTVDGTTVVSQITDLAGQEEYAPLRCRWYREADCFIGLYSITDKSSFSSLNAMRTDIMREQRDGQVPPIVLVGSKCDLASSRQVTYTEAKSLATRWGAHFKRGTIPFFEVSSVTGQNVETAFHSIIKLFLNPAVTKTPQKLPQQKKKRCFLM